DQVPKLRGLDLGQRLLDPPGYTTPEDAKLLTYVRENLRLHPKVVARKKISRTDIFELLFGNDEDAKTRAHLAFDDAYQHHIAEVHPLEPDVRPELERLHDVDIKVGLITNRRRDFLE